MIIITIDGPASSGKSSVAKTLSLKLNFVYFNTGLTYRAIGFLEANGIDFKKAIENRELIFELLVGRTNVYYKDEDITSQIQKENIGKLASEIAKYPDVREYIVSFQRSLVKNDAVVEGRDAGSYIFKEASFKFFIDADPKERALRRYLQENSSYEDILKSIIQRDETDKNREKYPFKAPEDAIKIDSTCLSLEEVVNLCMSFIWKR